MANSWEHRGTLATVTSPWVRLIAERWRDDAGHELEYWRVERAHSVVVAAQRGEELLLPAPQFRPGLGQTTLDLPGGRLADGQEPETAARLIVARELGLAPDMITTTRRLNQEGWPINSSFSNQRLFGVVAELAAEAQPSLAYEAIKADEAGLRALLARLECLQCRTVVLELLVAG